MFTQEDVLSMVKGAEINQLSRCQELVRTHGPGIITALAKTGWQKGSSALHFAAMGSLPVLQWFLEQEIDFNAIDSDGSTALMWAVYVGPKDPVQVLLARGANARLQDAVCTGANDPSPALFAPLSRPGSLRRILLPFASSLRLTQCCTTRLHLHSKD
eukprot:m.244644 g.244644  ORF g.244644 m.244644 type:complete len:158 (+) comp54465_c0_seq14:136-609(+)